MDANDELEWTSLARGQAHWDFVVYSVCLW